MTFNRYDNITQDVETKSRVNSAVQVFKEFWLKRNLNKKSNSILPKINNEKIQSKQHSEFKSHEPQTDKVYIIHGGKPDAYRLKTCMNFLEKTLGLEPVVYKPSRYDFNRNSITAFETMAKDCSAAIMILAPDKQTIDQNMLLEFGYFYGKFHKDRERKIIILYNSHINYNLTFSQVSRITYHHSIKQTFYQLESQLKHWKFFD
jgi:predicted nucleotide-binding protein